VKKVSTNNKTILRTPDKSYKQYQRFASHIVRPSVWPILASFSLGSILLCNAAYFNDCLSSLNAVFVSVLFFLFNVYLWFKDMVHEAYEGQHTSQIQIALRLGFILFIVSEIMFFVSFFEVFFILVWPHPFLFFVFDHQKG